MPDIPAVKATLTEVAQTTATSLDAAAREAKRTEFASRKRSRELRRQLDRLIEACEEYGIHLSIDTDPGGHSHG